MRNYTVYILQSVKDKGYYIGQTENLPSRLKKHERGQVRSTQHRRPLIFIKSEVYTTRGQARKRENYLKSLKGGNEFKKIVSYYSGVV